MLKDEIWIPSQTRYGNERIIFVVLVKPNFVPNSRIEVNLGRMQELGKAAFIFTLGYFVK